MFNFIKKAFKFSILIIVGIFVAFIILEVSLQVISLYKRHYYFYNQKKSVSLSNKEAIKIMCIGESTTQNQYPAFLEEYLKLYIPEKQFVIIDSGYPGIKLDDLYSKTKDNIDLYMPDIIVGMIGINDMIDYKFQSFSKIKVIYMLQLLFKHYKFSKYLLKGKKRNNDTNNLFAIDEVNNNNFIVNDDEAFAVKDKISRLINNNNTDILMDEIISDNKINMFNVYSMKNEFLSVFIRTYYSLKDADVTIKEVISKILNNDNIKKEFKYGFYGISNMLDGNFIIGNKFLDKADDERLTYNYDEISEKYEKILDLIITKGIKYIAMQYPVRDISSLQKIIEGTKYKNDVIFLSNKQNFRNALKTDIKDDIFADLFAWDFGHCRNSGNKLIAYNVAKKISGLMKK